MDSLFMLAAKKTHPCYSKDILSRSMNMSPECETIFLEKTNKVSVIMESTDEYGLDFYVSLIKPSGSIDLFFHKKRTCFSIVNVRDTTTAPVFHTKHKGIAVGAFSEYLLSECPPFVKEFITTRFNKKWDNLMEFSKKLMSLGGKYSTHIDCKGGNHSFVYH